jgi:hypothetical protein
MLGECGGFSKFGEFEYSTKRPILENRPDLLNLLTFANLVCSDSLNSSTFANLLFPDSPDSPTFAKGLFEKNVTRLDTFARVMSESREFGASGHCLCKTKNLFCSGFNHFLFLLSISISRCSAYTDNVIKHQ